MGDRDVQDDQDVIREYEVLAPVLDEAANRLQVIRDLANAVTTADSKARVKVICVLWLHTWKSQSSQNFPHWDDLLPVYRKVYGLDLDGQSVVRGWLKPTGELLKLPPPRPARQPPPDRDAPHAAIDSASVGRPTVVKDALPNERASIGRMRRHPLVSEVVRAGALLLVGAGVAAILFRAPSVPPNSATGAQDKDLRLLAEAMWKLSRSNHVAVPPGDPCLPYEGKWTMKKPYELDPDASAASGNPLFSRARNVEFFASCRSDEPGQPAKLVGLDVTTTDVYQRGHDDKDDRVAEAMNIVAAAITFENRVPSKREISDVERVPTRQFAQSPYYDGPRLANHLSALEELKGATCTTVEPWPDPMQMTFRCASDSGRFHYDKALRRSAVAPR